MMTMLDVARVTIELRSPMRIGTGTGDDLHDALVVTDANGLPTLPGSSLAGVLRARYRARYDEAAEVRLFGVVGSDEEGVRPSALSVSFGQVHDSNDRPVPARAARERLDDPLLRAARAMLVRPHVRIDGRGVADRHGLFDVELVHAGHRFTFELTVRHDGSDQELAAAMDRLLGLLGAGEVRLGASTRSGLGAFDVVRVARRRFDLRDAADFAAYRALPVALDAPVPEGVLVPQTDVEAAGGGTAVCATMTLALEGLWRIGGGVPCDQDRRDEGGDTRVPDAVPLREPRVRWHRDRGELDWNEVRPVVTGSSLKGALRHRVAFYLNALGGRFADDGDVSALEAHREEELRELFGGLPEGARAKAGRVLVEEPEIVKAPELAWQHHVTIDRFTGGALDGRLFDESACWRGAIRVTLRVQELEKACEAHRRALALALRDLGAGRLQLGAGDGRGHGRMRLEGRIAWSGPGHEGWQRAVEGV